MVFLPGRTEGGVGDLLRRGLGRLGCEGITYGPIMDYRDAIQAMRSSGCTSAVGLPAQLIALSRLGGGIKLKSVLLCSDYVSEAVRSAIETAWGCEVFSHYGMIETGLGGGVECSAHDGYHMREADLFFEIIDPVTGTPAGEGERGELVFTTLTRRGMPLIRYRTDDISRLMAEPCLCGSSLRRFERVSGRVCDAIDIGGGTALSMPMLDEMLFAVAGIIGFSAELVSDERGFSLVLTVHAKNGDRAIRDVRESMRADRQIAERIADGRFRLELRQGGSEVLTYGNSKRRIAYMR